MSDLEVQNLRKNFGGVQAVDGVSFTIESGARLGIIGPNGAGKTTMLNLLTGQLQPSGGRILFDGRDITSLSDYRRARLKIARTFQHTNIFSGLTVFENIRLSVQQRMGITRGMLPIGRYGDLREATSSVLSEHGLKEFADTPVDNLSYGDRRHLELVLALASDAKVLFLDEPTAGMTPGDTHDMIDYIDDIPDDISVCIVEHDMEVVFSLAERILVLHDGQVLAIDTPDSIKQNPTVQDVYLGKRTEFEA